LIELTTDRWPLLYWRSLAGILATALMLGFYARGGPAWLLGFVALVPWLRVLDARATTRGAVVAGLLMSFAFVASVFLWFGAAIGAFTGIGALPGMALLLVLAPVMQPQLLAFALVRHIVGRSHGPLLRAVAGASAWVACEWLLPKLLGDTLGHGLLPSALLRQSADLGGAAGLTFLLILVNEGIAIALARRREGVRAWLRPIGLATALVAAMSAYGVLRLHSLQAPPADEAPTLRVAMVQASITDYERLRREIGAYGVVRQVLDTHYELSMAALRDHQADVLLWSETVYPTTFGSPRSEDGAALDQEILGLVETLRVPLVFGTYDVDEAGEYNAAAFLEPGRGLIATYRKTHPFPLTEYVPPWLDHAWLRRLLPWAGTWKPGSGARVLPLRSADGREVNVVPLICLDDVRPGLAIDGARLGAQAIVGMSNDSWFTDYPVGARLHLSVAAFRSIETRLPQVRVTTNGLSAIIDDTGAVLATTGMGDQAVLTAYLSARDPAPTLMVRWGDWVGRAGLCLLALLAALAAWRAMRQRQAKADVGPYLARVAVLPPAARLAAGLLRAGAGLGLAWLALDMLLRTGLQVQSLTQLWIFLGAVLAPVVAAGAIGKHFAARAFIADGLLVLDQRTQRIEIPLGSIIAVRDWRLPLPGPGAHLELASGQRWHHGIAMANPAALERALADAGSPLLRQESAGKSIFAEFARTRAAGGRHRLDTALVKFVLFPLLPALVAFRLHQVIAFGGTFGELLTYGFTAWFSGLLIWWASWSLGLMLFAAVLRIVIEVGTLLMIPLGGDRAMAGRDAMTWLARGVYYLGVPAWLAIRLLQA
jgi:apolipoprotein N-acyltransferase